MPRDARFWRNVTIIALGHIVLGVLFIGWSRESRKLDRLSFVWIGDAGAPASSKVSTRMKSAAALERPETKPNARKDEDAPSVSQKTKSEIELPVVTPSPTPLRTPAPKPTATPSPKPPSKHTPSPTPKSKTKKSNAAKVTPTPSPKTHKSGEEQKKTADDNEKSDKPKATPGASSNTDGNNSSGASSSGGSSRASEFSWYARMLHDRFHSEWVQPTTSVPAGAKMSALVRIRIERDGRISKFTIIRPSGNLVVDESVQAVSKRVTQVEPLPTGLGAGKFYEVNINFELNPTQ